MTNKRENTLLKQTWPVKRIFKYRYETLNDPVVLEEPLEIHINGRLMAVLMRMPGDEKELAAGFCLSEGYIRDIKDILLIHHCGSGYGDHEAESSGGFESRNRVEIRTSEEKQMAASRVSDAVRIGMDHKHTHTPKSQSETNPRRSMLK
jgi:formate dehydrogenase accessory protein FdhD